MNRKLFAPALAAFAATAGLVFATCVINLDADSAKHEPWGDHNGNIPQTVNGYRTFEMTVTFSGGYITSINYLPNNETPEYGGAFLAQAVPLVIAANDFDLPAFDSMAGATRTKNGFIAAGKAITAQAESGNTGGSGQNPNPVPTPDPVTPHEAWGTASGYVTASEPSQLGEHEELDNPANIDVELGFQRGHLIYVDVKHKESEDFGAIFINKARVIMLANNDYNTTLFADIKAGCTKTADAFQNAVNAAFEDYKNGNATSFKAGQ